MSSSGFLELSVEIVKFIDGGDIGKTADRCQNVIDLGFEM
jgi:hypothetical protein